MTLVAGVDSSTQSCKVVIREAETGALVREGRAAHPDGTEVHPQAWWDALTAAIEQAGGIDDVAAIAVGAQQHGMVLLDADGEVVRPALLWNDTRSAQAAENLIAELGEQAGGGVAEGKAAWAQAVGVVPVASFTVTKLRWVADHEPAAADRTAAVCLPHDWLSWKLAGAPGLDALITDRGDASGTGYWSTHTEQYRPDLLRLGFRGREPKVPRVLAPAESALATPAGAKIGAGTGDNASAALGLGAQVGDVIVSIGTSGVACSVSATPAADASGTVAGFADATGRYLPLVATLNAARVLNAAAAILGVDLDELARLALSAPAGAGELVLVPYLEGERTPNKPNATGAMHGLRLSNSTPAHFARAAVEGMLCALADGLDAIIAQGAEVSRVILIGGGARSAAVRAIAPAIFGVPVVVPPPDEYVANGAARQAAWVVLGGAEPPQWTIAGTEVFEAPATPQVRELYRQARDLHLNRQP